MIDPISYSNRKGIYKDLYRTIDNDNKKRDVSNVSRPKRGIYKNLYRQIEEDKNAIKLSMSSRQNDGKSFWNNKYVSRLFYYINNLGKVLKPII